MKVNIYNVSEERKNDDGILLLRYPYSVREKLGYSTITKGQIHALEPSMVEIEILDSNEQVAIELMALDNDSYVYGYIDDFQAARFLIHKGVKEKITLKMHDRMLNLESDIKDFKRRFRFIVGNGSRVVYYPTCDYSLINDDGYVLYGSSISMGAGAFDIVNSYAFLTAKFNNIRIFNKALSGSCLLEPEAIDYLASLNPKGYILEIGANVRGVMDDCEFRKRVKYMLNTLKQKQVDIYLISILDMFENLYNGFKDIPYHEKNVSFIKILKEEANNLNYSKLHLISSKNLITTIDGISYDMLHPANYGHLQMALNLKIGEK